MVSLFLIEVLIKVNTIIERECYMQKELSDLELWGVHYFFELYNLMHLDDVEQRLIRRFGEEAVAYYYDNKKYMDFNSHKKFIGVKKINNIAEFWGVQYFYEILKDNFNTTINSNLVNDYYTRRNQRDYGFRKLS